MPKKKPDDGPPAPRPSKRPPDLSAEAYSDDLTTAEILAQSPPIKPRRRKRETAKSLGVYDADRDILDQYLFEVSQTPLLTAQQEIAIAKRVRAGDEEAMQELV
jgi:DNA-directed RNA polymerase sigma subunit (sigma70/sigma32)